MKVDYQNQHIYQHSYNDTYVCIPFKHNGWHILVSLNVNVILSQFTDYKVLFNENDNMHLYNTHINFVGLWSYRCSVLKFISIGFWNCSESVVFYGCMLRQTRLNKIHVIYFQCLRRSDPIFPCMGSVHSDAWIDCFCYEVKWLL
jgi:hypothetical protein